MSNWLLQHRCPTPFIIEDCCELIDIKTGVGSIKCVQQDLSVAEVSNHIRAGKQVVSLALSWSDKLYFILSDDFSLKRIKPLDIIEEQIKVAAGVPISGKDYEPALHAIECRINAEDPENDFRPSPGKITNFHSPGGHGVRIDTHAYAGYVIPPYYDSMIAKLITVGQTREVAIEKMKRALDEFVIEGVKTTIPFHLALMDHEAFRSGNYTTKFMEEYKIL